MIWRRSWVRRRGRSPVRFASAPAAIKAVVARARAARRRSAVVRVRGAAAATGGLALRIGVKAAIGAAFGIARAPGSVGSRANRQQRECREYSRSENYCPHECLLRFGNRTQSHHIRAREAARLSTSPTSLTPLFPTQLFPTQAGIQATQVVLVGERAISAHTSSAHQYTREKNRAGSRPCSQKRKATNATVTPRILCIRSRRLPALRRLILPRLGPRSQWRDGSPTPGFTPRRYPIAGALSWESRTPRACEIMSCGAPSPRARMKETPH